MKNNKVLTVIAAIALLAVGYIGGCYFGFPSSQDELLSGDVSKAKANGTDVVDPDMVTALQLIATEGDSKKNSLQDVALLSSQIEAIETLTDASMEVTKNAKDFEKLNKFFTDLKRKADTAKESLVNLKAANVKIADGHEVDNINYLSTKALLSFLVLDNAISNGEIGDMLDYSREMDNQDVTTALAKWMDYSSDDVTVKPNANDLALWKKVYTTLGIDENGSAQRSLTSK